MCAPQTYLDALGAMSLYQHRVPYEAIQEWFACGNNARSSWRARVVGAAIEQGRRGYTMIVNQVVTDFHKAYWQYLRKHHPQIVMAEPTPKGSKSNWIILKGRSFPKKVRLHHKLDKRVLELGFEGRDIAELAERKPDWPDEMILVQKGGTAAISIDVPNIDMSLGIAAQHHNLEGVFSAAYRLFPYAGLLREGEDI
jgi:hypothetical protein